VLADWAAIAIDNAACTRAPRSGAAALERAVLGLEATTAIARAVGGETDLDRVLELIVKRGRALVDARALVIVLRDAERLDGGGRRRRGRGRPRPRGHRVGVGARAVMREQRPENIADVRVRLRTDGAELGRRGPAHRAARPARLPRPGARRPVRVRPARRRAAFADDHERLLLAFAASAATAVATARNVAEERLRHSMSAAEEERRRWARELHDDTLQAMAGVRLTLASALRKDDPARREAAMRQAVEDLATNIDALRSLITDLRPAALDELGLTPALGALADRVAAAHGVDVRAEIDLAFDERRAPTRLVPDVETAVYRVVQEALTNVAKHGGATHVRVAVREEGAWVRIEVRDDGRGFDTTQRGAGFGITGMQERMTLLGGELSIESSPDGTVVRASAPARHRDAPAGRARRAWPSASEVDEPVLERVAHELGAAGAAQLVLDVRPVRLHRAHAEVELLGDLGVRVAQRDEPQDGDLALGQVVGRPGGRRRLGDHPRAELRVEVRLALRGGADRLDELVVGRLLEHVGLRPGLQRLAREARLVLHRQHDDRGPGDASANAGSPAGSPRRAC
jgi:signal transduction histidine kinase